MNWPCTSANNPYCFWLNNNYDGLGRIWDADSDYTDVQQDLSGNNDLSRTAISYTRDLEDYTRLAIQIQGPIQQALINGNIVVKLESSGPQIRLFRKAANDGGISYLIDASSAQNQITAPYNQQLGLVGSYQFQPGFWNNYTFWNNSMTAYFLFDGISSGPGNLKASLYVNNGNSLTKFAESQPVWLNLKNVKDMYDTWTVTASGNTPSTSASGSSVYSPASPETGQYTLFVHGWNMSQDDKDHFANTAYKRLWWQGFTGRFGAFDWPTLTGVTTYNDSEYIAWQSAKALASKLTDLNALYPNNVYLFAHSMGNVVAGEALKINNSNGNGVQAYVACQAAIPNHAYDPNNTSVWETSSSTPDEFANYWTPGQPCYFNGVTSGGSRANFYNVNDWALGWWVTDQSQKPSSGHSWDGTHYYEDTFYVISHPTATYEIFAYCVQSPCLALGATANVDSSLFAPVNCADLWGFDPFKSDPTKFFSDHCWHSGEFYFSTVEQWGWWNDLKASLLNH